jgi:hypothetical protein
MSWRISSGPFMALCQESVSSTLPPLDRAEEQGLRLLDGAEEERLRLLVDGGVADLAAHDSAEEQWLRH